MQKSLLLYSESFSMRTMALTSVGKITMKNNLAQASSPSVRTPSGGFYLDRAEAFQLLGDFYPECLKGSSPNRPIFIRTVLRHVAIFWPNFIWTPQGIEGIIGGSTGTTTQRSTLGNSNHLRSTNQHQYLHLSNHPIRSTMVSQFWSSSSVPVAKGIVTQWSGSESTRNVNALGKDGRWDRFGLDMLYSCSYKNHSIEGL